MILRDKPIKPVFPVLFYELGKHNYFVFIIDYIATQAYNRAKRDYTLQAIFFNFTIFIDFFTKYDTLITLRRGGRERLDT